MGEYKPRTSNVFPRSETNARFVTSFWWLGLSTSSQNEAVLKEFHCVPSMCVYCCGSESRRTDWSSISSGGICFPVQLSHWSSISEVGNLLSRTFLAVVSAFQQHHSLYLNQTDSHPHKRTCFCSKRILNS